MADTRIDLLAPVTLRENPQQDEAFTVAIDRVTRAATVTVNPELLDAEGQHKARIRGAVTLLLSGFAAYNRDILGRYGTWPAEQQVYDRAYDEAREKIEGALAQLYPFAPAQAGEQAEPLFAETAKNFRTTVDQLHAGTQQIAQAEAPAPVPAPAPRKRRSASASAPIAEFSEGQATPGATPGDADAAPAPDTVVTTP